MLPHLPQNTSTRSLSPTSPAFRPSSPSLSCPILAHSGLGYETLQDPRWSGGHKNLHLPQNKTCIGILPDVDMRCAGIFQKRCSSQSDSAIKIGQNALQSWRLCSRSHTDRAQRRTTVHHNLTRETLDRGAPDQNVRSMRRVCGAHMLLWLTGCWSRRICMFQIENVRAHVFLFLEMLTVPKPTWFVFDTQGQSVSIHGTLTWEHPSC